MKSVYVLYIVIFIVLLASIILLLFHRKPKRKKNIQAEYISGLHALIEGDRDTALSRLRNVVRRDTDYVDAYTVIGNIFREKGMFENAIKVHRDLLVRPNLSLEHQKSILSSLVLDYKMNDQPKWALATCDKIMEIDKKNQWIKNIKLELYEDMGDWQGAFDILKKNTLMDKTQKNARLAAYKVEQGLQLVALKQEHDARVRFREAIKQSNSCYAAFREIIQSYIRENREKDALKELKKLLQTIPDFADIAVNEFEKLLYDMGEFSEIENLYRQIIHANPHVSAAYLALAEFYQRQGELVKASEYARKVLHFEPKNPKVLLFLVQVENKLRRYESSAELAAQVAEIFAEKKFSFVCRQCHHEFDHYFWRCAACAAWNSAERA